MRIRIALTDEAKAQRASLAPVPKRVVREALREMEKDLYALDTIPLQPPAEDLHRVRVDDYRIVFEFGPGHREITVVRIGHRSWVYEDLGRLPDDG